MNDEELTSAMLGAVKAKVWMIDITDHNGDGVAKLHYRINSTPNGVVLLNTSRKGIPLKDYLISDILSHVRTILEVHLDEDDINDGVKK